jgi:hypothetical protein
MSTVRFFCDEPVAVFPADAVLRKEPAIEVWCVGQGTMPPKGTPDPDLLIFAEDRHYLFLTLDRKTMATHIADHLTAGRHTWGVFSLRIGFPVLRYADNLVLIWSESQAEDWVDYVGWLPW